MSCCNNIKGSCNQGRLCPVRRANSFPLVTGQSFKGPLPPVEPPEPPTDLRDLVLYTIGWLALVSAAGFFTTSMVYFLTGL